MHAPERSGRNPGSMLATDLRRMFTQRLFYIMLLICICIPVLMLVMTAMAGGADVIFTNVWQAIGSVDSSGMSMDLTTMCNINLVYFLAAVTACVFTAEDFRSGACKNFLAVRPSRLNYVLSKTAVCFLAGACMLLAYFAGAMIGGKVAGLSFAMNGFSAFSLLLCMLAKLLLMAVFAAIYVLMAVIAKQRTWMSILLSLMIGMFMFMVIPMMTPLNAGFLNVVMCLAGGLLFAAGFGAISSQVLQRTDVL